ncbi:MAG TPA: GNAT family N-acetyltransferase [Actinocrinis sp.]|nr:GNAT family N-acetyltransferase [Actinocrinis sp.]
MLRLDHAPALLAFELANREYFARTISDRGDAYFAEFDSRHAEMLAEQAAGAGYFHVFVDGDGSVLGRINLFDVAGGSANLGYRIAEHAAGRGLATSGVRQVCALAAGQYGLISVRALTSVDNVGSRTVLARTGFQLVGEAVVGGRPGLSYIRILVDRL